MLICAYFLLRKHESLSNVKCINCKKCILGGGASEGTVNRLVGRENSTRGDIVHTYAENVMNLNSCDSVLGNAQGSTQEGELPLYSKSLFEQRGDISASPKETSLGVQEADTYYSVPHQNSQNTSSNYTSVTRA